MIVGRVYKIVSSKGNQIYIGSTIKTLRRRFQLHKKDTSSSNILFDKYGVDNCRIELIKEYEVCDELHLQVYEQLWINKYKDKVVNKLSSFCIKKLYMKQYKKKYRENNREEIREKDKKYRDDHKEEIREKQKKHYENNRDKILEKFDCECGGKYVYSHKSRHFKTKKHQDYIKKKNH